MAVVEHPLVFRKPAQTSRDVLTEKPSSFLVVQNEQGTIGVGECSLIPGLSLESAEDAKQALRAVAESGTLDSMSIPASLPAVRFAVETAAWDVSGGGQGAFTDSSFVQGEKPIDINGLVWMGSPDFMRRQFYSLAESGFTTLKCKVGAHDWDVESRLLLEVRAQLPSNRFTLRVDANGALSRLALDETRRRLEFLAKLEIHSIEQPLMPRDRDGLAELCEDEVLPIALDESLIGVHSLAERVRLLEHIRPQHLVLKPSLIGGMDSATVWSKVAERQGMGWWVTSALESNLGLSAIAQWAAMQPSVQSEALGLTQGLGTGGLFTNNVDGPLSVDAGKLHWDPEWRRNPDAWKEALRGAVLHSPGCACGMHHKAP